MIPLPRAVDSCSARRLRPLSKQSIVSDRVFSGPSCESNRMIETVGEALPFLDEMLEWQLYRVPCPRRTLTAKIADTASGFSNVRGSFMLPAFAPIRRNKSTVYFRNSADEPSATQPTIIEGLENDEDHVQDIDEG
jgi:hypothetical protein